MKKNVVVPIVILAVLVLIGFGAWQASQNKPAPEPEAVAEETAAPDLPLEERKEYDKKIHELENEVARARASASVPVATPPTPATPAESPGDASPMKSAMKELTKMMEDPKVQEMMRAQQKMMLDTTYGELFQGLSLQGAELDTMKDLLIDKMMSGMESGMTLMDSSLTPEQRAAEVKKITDAQVEANRKIREFLGDEDYELFERFEQTQMERTQVDLFKQSLAGEQQLAWEQEDALIALMHEETSNFKYSTDIGQNMNLPPTDFSDEAMNSHLRDVEKLHGRYVERAVEVLDETQVAQFEESLSQFRSMQEMSYKMARSMFGGEGEENDE